MSEQQWGKGHLFEPPVVRVEVEQQLKIERPVEIATRQVMAPPEQVQAALQAVQNDPQLAAELWQQVNAEPAPTEQPPGAAQSITELSLALYLLQTLHAEGKPGFEHLIREVDAAPDDDQDERETPGM